MSENIIDLDTLAVPVGKAKVLGQWREVLPISGIGYRALMMFQNLQKNAEGLSAEVQEEVFKEMAKVAGRLCPSLTLDEVGDLNIQQIIGIISVAANKVQLVEKLFPNGLPVNQTPATTRLSESS